MGMDLYNSLLAAKLADGGDFSPTTAQLAAMNSGITSEKVSEISEKANTTDVETTTNALQAQIDEVAQSAGAGTADTELGQARIDINGAAYSTINGRISADERAINGLCKGFKNGKYSSRGLDWVDEVTPNNKYNSSMFVSDYYKALQGCFIKSITYYAKGDGILRLNLLPVSEVSSSTSASGSQKLCELTVTGEGVQTQVFENPIYCPKDRVLAFGVSTSESIGYSGTYYSDDQRGWMITSQGGTYASSLALCVGFEYTPAEDILKPVKGISESDSNYIEMANGVRLYISNTEPSGTIPEGSKGLGFATDGTIKTYTSGEWL